MPPLGSQILIRPGYADDEHGLMRRREASINDLAIEESDRRIFGPRAEGERGVDIPLQ